MRKDDGSAPIITRYLPFGGYRGGSGPNQVTDRGFTGQPENMDLGLYYYQARFYVPGIGRFASADTIVPDPTRPQSYNRYSYVENRPLVAVDPTGHDPAWCNDPYDAGNDPACNGFSGTPTPTGTPTSAPTGTSTPTPTPTTLISAPYPVATPTRPATPSVLESMILASTVLLEFLYQGPVACLVGTNQFCMANSHATIMDDHTLLSHNHFQEFSFSIHSITIYDAYGNVIPDNGQLIQHYLSNSQTSRLTFAPGTFSNQTSATFGSVFSTSVQVGDRVAVIDWDGINSGSTHVVWANVTAVTYHEGVPALQVDVNIRGGASGGGVFFNGIHIANNWSTGKFDPYSWAALNQ